MNFHNLYTANVYEDWSKIKKNQCERWHNLICKHKARLFCTHIVMCSNSWDYHCLDSNRNPSECSLRIGNHNIYNPHVSEGLKITYA